MNFGPAIEAFGWAVPWAFMLGMLGALAYVVVLLRRLLRVTEAVFQSMEKRPRA